MSDQQSHDTFFDEFGDDKRQRRSLSTGGSQEDFRELLTQPSVTPVRSFRRTFKKKSSYLDLLSSKRPYVRRIKRVVKTRKVYKRPTRRFIKPVARVTCSCSVSHSTKRYSKPTPKRFYRKR
jgi:hypothetical protein